MIKKPSSTADLAILGNVRSAVVDRPAGGSADAPGCEFMYLDPAPPRPATNDATIAKTPESTRRMGQERRACAVVLGPSAPDD
jgi:hypothetical protein